MPRSREGSARLRRDCAPTRALRARRTAEELRAITDVASDYKTTATPRQPGLGGFVDDTGAMGGIYYDPAGPATRKSRELTGNGWGVGPHGEGGDYAR